MHKRWGLSLVVVGALGALPAAARAEAPCDTRALVEAVRDAAPEALRAQLLSLDGAPTSRGAACRAVVRARAQLALGETKAAVALLADAEDGLPEVAPYLAWLRADALLRAGDAAGARAAAAEAEKVARDPWLKDALSLVVAEAHEAERDWAKAVHAHRALLQAKAGDEALLRAHLGRALIAAGRKREGHAELKRVLVRAPGHPEARALEALLDDGTLTLSLGEQARRVDALIKASRFSRAALEATRALEGKALSSPDAIDLEVHAVTALVRAGRIDDAVARAERGAGPAAPEELKKIRAWALGKAARRESAAAAWRDVEEAASSPERKAEACFFSGFLLYEANETAKARARLEACGPVLEETKWAVAGRWYRALLALLDGDAARAAVLLDELVEAAPTDREALKHRYWLARALLLEGDGGDRASEKRARGRALLEELAQRHPATWYGMLATARLGRAPPRGAKVAPDALARLAAGDESAQRARLLYALGFDEAARDLAARRGHRAADLALSQAVGDAHRAWRYGASLLPASFVAKGGRLRAKAGFRASYALPFPELVEDACRRHGLDPSFAWSIMRTESGFLPTATSRAGAIGLLQLMPYTARGMAQKLGLPEPRPGDLARPRVNIDLGVAFLATAEREFGHPLLAAAVYNGGPDNVARWLQDFGHLEPELFVERIPFLETRNYVKSVLETAAVYRALSGAPLALTLPTAPLGGGPKAFTWFPPSEEAEVPVEGATAPGG